MLTCDISSLLNALKLPVSTHKTAKHKKDRRKGAPTGAKATKRNIQGQINRPCGFDCFQGPSRTVSLRALVPLVSGTRAGSAVTSRPVVVTVAQLKPGRGV